MKRIKHFVCACCGSDAPAMRQWMDRDAGYGCCSRCFRAAVAREGQEAAERCYGKAGVHHSIEKYPAEVGIQQVNGEVVRVRGFQEFMAAMGVK